MYAAGHNAVNVFDLVHSRVHAGCFQHHLRRNACGLSELLIRIDFTGRQNRNCRPVVQLVVVVCLQKLIPIRSVFVRVLVFGLDRLVEKILRKRLLVFPFKLLLLFGKLVAEFRLFRILEVLRCLLSGNVFQIVGYPGIRKRVIELLHIPELVLCFVADVLFTLNGSSKNRVHDFLVGFPLQTVDPFFIAFIANARRFFSKRVRVLLRKAHCLRLYIIRKPLVDIAI